MLQESITLAYNDLMLLVVGVTAFFTAAMHEFRFSTSDSFREVIHGTGASAVISGALGVVFAYSVVGMPLEPAAVVVFGGVQVGAVCGGIASGAYYLVLKVDVPERLTKA